MDDEHRQLLESLHRRMEDNRRLFESLHRAREFTVTEDHLKLLRHARATTGDPGEGYNGAAGIDAKRPYGNSYMERDIAEILDAPDEDWEYENGEKTDVTDEAEERFRRLHIETMFVLQSSPPASSAPAVTGASASGASTGNATTAAISRTDGTGRRRHPRKSGGLRIAQPVPQQVQAAFEHVVAQFFRFG
jgi:hypothetical protein